MAEILLHIYALVLIHGLGLTVKIIKIITTDLISVYPKLSPAVDQDILLAESGKDLDQILFYNAEIRVGAPLKNSIADIGGGADGPGLVYQISQKLLGTSCE